MTPAKRRRTAVPERHRWFDDWLAGDGSGMRLLVDRTIRFLDHHEEVTRARRRARRQADRALHERRVEVVIVNLARAVLDPPETGRLAISTRNGTKGRTRYQNPALGKRLSPLLGMMAEVGIVDWRNPTTIRGEASSIAPTPWFANRVAEAGATLAHIGRDHGQELILLTRNDQRLGATGGRTTHRERINYTDTAVTNAFRAAMGRLNDFLKAADVAFNDDGQEPLINARERVMRRHFGLLKGDTKPRFDRGGRLFGGFWQTMPSARRRNIRINSEPGATLDYGSMFTRLAYAELGLVPPSGDLYAIDGLDGYRSGVKMAMNTLLFDTGRRQKWPSALGIGVGDDADAADDPTGEAASFKARLPAGYGVKKTKTAVLRRHPALAAAWGRGLGYKLMFIESQVLVAVLEQLMAEGIPALGLHDGLLVAKSQMPAAMEVMVSVSRLITGIELPVAIKVTGEQGDDRLIEHGTEHVLEGATPGGSPTIPCSVPLQLPPSLHL